MSSEGWLVKTTSRPGTNEVLCLFSCFFFIQSFFIFFFFSIFLARSDKPRYPPADNERRSAAGPEWSDGSWATPRDASWSIPPGNRPTGKHLASWGITYQMEPGYVLVDSQKSCRLRWEEQHIPCQRRQTGTGWLAADVEMCDRRLGCRAETGDGEKVLRAKLQKKEGKEETSLTADTVSPLGRKHVLIWNECNLQDANPGEYLFMLQSHIKRWLCCVKLLGGFLCSCACL